MSFFADLRRSHDNLGDYEGATLPATPAELERMRSLRSLPSSWEASPVSSSGVGDGSGSRTCKRRFEGPEAGTTLQRANDDKDRPAQRHRGESEAPGTTEEQEQGTGNGEEQEKIAATQVIDVQAMTVKACNGEGDRAGNTPERKQDEEQAEDSERITPEKPDKTHKPPVSSVLQACSEKRKQKLNSFISAAGGKVTDVGQGQASTLDLPAETALENDVAQGQASTLNLPAETALENDVAQGQATTLDLPAETALDSNGLLDDAHSPGMLAFARRALQKKIKAAASKKRKAAAQAVQAPRKRNAAASQASRKRKADNQAASDTSRRIGAQEAAETALHSGNEQERAAAAAKLSDGITEGWACPSDARDLIETLGKASADVEQTSVLEHAAADVGHAVVAFASAGTAPAPTDEAPAAASDAGESRPDPYPVRGESLCEENTDAWFEQMQAFAAETSAVASTEAT